MGFGGAKRRPKKFVLEVFFGLGRVLGPRWPQDPSRDLPRPIFLDFEPQLGGFWTPTWLILGPNSMDFGPLGLTFSMILDLKRCVRPQGCAAVCRRHLDIFIVYYLQTFVHIYLVMIKIIIYTCDHIESIL